MATAGTERADTVRAADTCLRILELIALSSRAMGVSEVAATVGMAKGAAHKHLRTLVDHGLILQNAETTLYSPGPKLWIMGQNAPAGRQLADIALPLMRTTRDALGLAVVLSVPTTTAAFVVTTLSSNQPIEIGVRPGGELRLHSSAQGKVFLAFGPPALFGSLRVPLQQVTPKSITDPEVLRAELAVIRERGYATAPEQSLLGINAVAAPIFSRDRALVGSIGLIGSIQYLADEPSSDQRRALFDLTEAISQRLG